jgi:hypothetical protein
MENVYPFGLRDHGLPLVVGSHRAVQYAPLHSVFDRVPPAGEVILH